MNLKELEFLYNSECEELDFLKARFKDESDIENVQTKIYEWYYAIGRLSLIEDLIKQEFGYKEREFQIRKKKGTLFEGKN